MAEEKCVRAHWRTRDVLFDLIFLKSSLDDDDDDDDIVSLGGGKGGRRGSLKLGDRQTGNRR